MLTGKWKKIIFTLGALLLVVGASYFAKGLMSPQVGEKEISITIIDEADNKTLLEEKEFRTNATTLAEFLKEKEEELKVIYEDSEYGMFITGLYGVETTDQNNGPWWLYSYESPEQELSFKTGEAPAADSLTIQNGDRVVFSFKNSFGN